MIESLVQKEKEATESTACNQYRKFLVRQLLPVLCDTDLQGVSNKQFYKWIQKSIEHYTCAFTKKLPALGMYFRKVYIPYYFIFCFLNIYLLVSFIKFL